MRFVDEENITVSSHAQSTNAYYRGVYYALARQGGRMHTVEEKPKLILRIKRIKGQIAAIERALEADQDCSDVLQLITAARGAMNGLMAELLEGHIRFHVVNPKQQNSEQALAADELVEIVRSYLK